MNTEDNFFEEQEYIEFMKLLQDQQIHADEYCEIMKSFFLTSSTNN